MSPDARVLIVDDDRLLRLRTRRMLELMAITKVIDVEDGGLALQLFWHAPSAFDLTICDWNMPLMSGVDVCKQIRAARPTLPFIMVTGRLDLMSVRTAKESGVSAYIARPFSAQQLLVKLSALLE